MLPFLPENVSDISDSFSHKLSHLTVVKVQGRKDTEVQTCKPANLQTCTVTVPPHRKGELSSGRGEISVCSSSRTD